MALINKKIINSYTKIIKRIIKDLSKCISVYVTPVSVECPGCLFDVVHQKSAGVRNWTPAGSSYTVFEGTNYEHTYYESNTNFTRGRCPICFGSGKLSRPNKTSINALVTWKRSTTYQGNQEWFPSGLDNVLSCRLKTEICNYDILNDAEYFLIDNIKMVLFRPPDFYGLGGTNSLCVAYLVDANEAYLSKTVSES